MWIGNLAFVADYPRQLLNFSLCRASYTSMSLLGQGCTQDEHCMTDYEVYEAVRFQSIRVTYYLILVLHTPK